MIAKQKQLLDFIKARLAETGVCPSMAEITRLREELAHEVEAHAETQAALRAMMDDLDKARADVMFAAGIEVAGKAWAIAVDMELHAAIGTTTEAKAKDITAAIRALTPPDIAATAARVLIPELEKRHQAYIAGKGRDPKKYTSSFDAAAKCLRAIADGGDND